MATDREQPQRTDLAGTGEGSLERMRALLDRPLPREEIEENTALVAAQAETRAVRLRSVLVFAIGGEMLALEADETHRVVPCTAVRRVPHRTNNVFLGLANVAGELTPVAALGAALGVGGEDAHTHFIVIGSAGSRWAFGVGHLSGVRRVDEKRIMAAPTTVRHAADGCTQYLVPVEEAGREHIVAVLDAGKLIAQLSRSLT